MPTDVSQRLLFSTRNAAFHDHSHLQAHSQIVGVVSSQKLPTVMPTSKPSDQLELLQDVSIDKSITSRKASNVGFLWSLPAFR